VTDQLTVSKALDELDGVGNTAATNDVEHVGGGQDFVITAAEPDRAHERVDISVLIHEADVISRIRDGEMRDAQGVHALVRHVVDRAGRDRVRVRRAGEHGARDVEALVRGGRAGGQGQEKREDDDNEASLLAHGDPFLGAPRH